MTQWPPNTAPPQVTIVRSKYKTNNGHGSLLDDRLLQGQWRYIGIHSTPNEIAERAYYRGGYLFHDRVILPPEMQAGFYDYIANLTNGSQQSLQGLIKRKFGLVGKYEMRDRDVLLLKVARTEAPGLRPGTPSPGQLTRVSNGTAHYKNCKMSDLAAILEERIDVPVVNQTGLAGNYDLDIPANFGATPAERLDTARQVLLDQFGLELVPTNMPIGMLVIEKAY